MYNASEFEENKDINIYMSPELFASCFVKKNNKVE